MIIDENTKIIGRLHSLISPRGLNIYNPLFQELKINALYLLFHNPDPKKLIDGLRKLNLSGAITVGFETDPRLAKLVDKFDDMSEYLGKVGFIKNVNGILHASYQGGEGMYRTIKKSSGIKNKKIVIVGAGQVTKSLLFFMKGVNELPSETEIYNRTIKNAKELSTEYKFITKTGGLNDLNNSSGDVLINLSNIGGAQNDNLFTKEIVSKFKAIVDVTFEKENTNLISMSKKLRKKYSTGWDMFAYQGQVALESILKQKIPFAIIRKHVIQGLTQTVK
jgi:shikimate 5-dehydrogenase